MGECSWWFHTIWSSEVQLFLSSVVLFKVVGYGALPGLVPLHNRNCEFKWLAEAQLKKVEKKNPLPNSEKSLEIQGGIFTWYPELAIPTLREVNLEIGLGEKIAICGPVGAGKSSFLYAILGEIPKLSGTVRVYETVAYVSQTSWMQSGTTGNYVELLEAGTTFEQLVNAKENLKRDTWFGRRRVMDRTPLNQAEKAAKGLPGAQLTQEEEKEIGDVGWTPFWDYILVSKGSFRVRLIQ
ncbi:hypothetical protein L484_000623 [Morus notabilis]|uniref:ABC transporter domain-containing protein n=1 Tax=Morus notabilis TaxID=981085 RepID=W9RXG3_9ROSA|nr:hypothetical protein L484_000623 [Morus notabilis]